MCNGVTVIRCKSSPNHFQCDRPDNNRRRLVVATNKINKINTPTPTFSSSWHYCAPRWSINSPRLRAPFYTINTFRFKSVCVKNCGFLLEVFSCYCCIVIGCICIANAYVYCCCSYCCYCQRGWERVWGAVLAEVLKWVSHKFKCQEVTPDFLPPVPRAGL